MKIYLENKKNDMLYPFDDKSNSDLGYTELLETEKLTEENMFNVLNINGTNYKWRQYSKKRNELLVKAITLKSEADIRDEFESNLKCPYCGYEDIDSWELEEDDSEYECTHCGGIISYERCVTVDYSSEAIRPPTIVHLT